MNVETLLNGSPPPCPSICGRINGSLTCGSCPYGTKIVFGDKSSTCVPCKEPLSWFETCFIIFYFLIPFVVNGKKIIFNYYYIDSLSRWKGYENVEIYENERTFKLAELEGKTEESTRNIRKKKDEEIQKSKSDIEEIESIEKLSDIDTDEEYDHRTIKENIMANLPFVEHCVVLIIETVIPTLLAIYLIPPSYSFEVNSCRSDDLKNWYPFFNYIPELSKETNFFTRNSKSCSYEIVFPLFSLPLLHTVLSLSVYIITRSCIFIFSRFRYSLATDPIHIGLWIYPIQIFSHIFFGGIIYTYFPFICIIYAFRQYSHDLDELSTPFIPSLYNEIKKSCSFTLKIIGCTSIYYLAFFSMFSKYHESKFDFFTAAIFSLIPTIMFPQLKRFFKPFLKEKDLNRQERNPEDFFNSEEMLQLREALRDNRERRNVL
uniref:JNK1/MAPK8-associated membrane protein n=1 Tax=Parastrongyloides trichosuri TaxID=131310 RepID=A0A0N4ZS08_PARTI